MRELRRVFVTGAGGFVGGHLVERLCADGIAVRALVRDTLRLPWVTSPHLEVCVGSIQEPDTWRRALSGCDTVVHCAAAVGDRARDVTEATTTNVEGTVRLLEACADDAGVTRIVHVSTVSVLGHATRGDVATEATEPAPLVTDVYATTKLAAERVVQGAVARGAPAVIVRPMWVYGWRARGVRRLFDLIARGRMVLIGGGGNAIQPIAAEDLVEALVRAARTPGIDGEIVTCAGPVPMTTAEMCAEIAAALGVAAPRRTVPLPLARVAALLCDVAYPRWLGRPPLDRQKLSFFTLEHAYSNERAWRVMGWRPRIDFTDGVKAVADALSAGVVR